MEVNQERLNEFMGKVLGDVGAATNALLIRIGDKLGIYKTLAAKGPVTPKERGSNRDGGALHPRVAVGAGGVRLRRL